VPMIPRLPLRRLLLCTAIGAVLVLLGIVAGVVDVAAQGRPAQSPFKKDLAIDPRGIAWVEPRRPFVSEVAAIGPHHEIAQMDRLPARPLPSWAGLDPLAGERHDRDLQFGALAYGWPWRAARLQRWEPHGRVLLRHRRDPSRLRNGRALRLPHHWNAAGPVWLPLEPVWPGLIGNLLVLSAAPAFVLAGCGAARRGLRRRRGRCPCCGYDRRGVALRAVCPECGHRPAAGGAT